MSLCDNKQFQVGNVHTDFIKENKDALFHLQEITPTIAVAAASAFINSQQQVQYNTDSNAAPSFFTACNTSFRPNYSPKQSLTLAYDKKSNYSINKITTRGDTNL